MNPLAIEWCRDPARAADIAALFVAHADPSYISHSELQYGRALAPDCWAKNLHAKVLGEATTAIANVAGGSLEAGQWLAIALMEGRLAGFAFVTFKTEADIPFAVLDDCLVVPEARGHGAGRTILDWIFDQCRAQGLARVFLESGLTNHRAHHFFENQGFVQTSIVMMRDL